MLNWILHSLRSGQIYVMWEISACSYCVATSSSSTVNTLQHVWICFFKSWEDTYMYSLIYAPIHPHKLIIIVSTRWTALSVQQINICSVAWHFKLMNKVSASYWLQMSLNRSFSFNVSLRVPFELPIQPPPPFLNKLNLKGAQQFQGHFQLLGEKHNCQKFLWR